MASVMSPAASTASPVRWALVHGPRTDAESFGGTAAMEQVKRPAQGGSLTRYLDTFWRARIAVDVVGLRGHLLDPLTDRSSPGSCRKRPLARVPLDMSRTVRPVGAG